MFRLIKAIIEAVLLSVLGMVFLSVISGIIRLFIYSAPQEMKENFIYRFLIDKGIINEAQAPSGIMDSVLYVVNVPIMQFIILGVGIIIFISVFIKTVFK